MNLEQPRQAGNRDKLQKEMICRMKIQKTAVAGTMESSDIMVTIAPNEGNGMEIDLDSTVEKQYGKIIRRTIEETLKELKVHDARVHAVDKGALDCAIQARVKTAAYRASGEQSYQWGGEAK